MKIIQDDFPSEFILDDVQLTTQKAIEEVKKDIGLKVFWENAI